MNACLRKLQLTQLEILKVIDCFCKRFDIKYSLYAGTLLGAVRHQGFIPWDDDLDICMERSEYTRFIELWEEYGPKEYLLQNKENTSAFSQSFTKIRKDNTTFLQDGEQDAKYHTGIFVDVFPVDRMPAGNVKRKIFWGKCMMYQLYTREFAPPKAGHITKMGALVLLALTPRVIRPAIRNRLLRSITKNNDNLRYNMAMIETVSSMHISYPANMTEKYSYISFENCDFMCFENWDEHLRCKFGEYMQLPPIEERVWKHSPVIIDFERNYEDIKC